MAFPQHNLSEKTDRNRKEAKQYVHFKGLRGRLLALSKTPYSLLI